MGKWSRAELHKIQSMIQTARSTTRAPMSNFPAKKVLVVLRLYHYGRTVNAPCQPLLALVEIRYRHFHSHDGDRLLRTTELAASKRPCRLPNLGHLSLHYRSCTDTMLLEAPPRPPHRMDAMLLQALPHCDEYHRHRPAR